MRLIQGGNQPKKYRDVEDEPIICAGCGGSVFIEIVKNPRRRRMKWLKRSGERGLQCITCKTICA